MKNGSYTIRLEDSKTPIIYVSFHDDETKMLQLLRNGVNDYLVKPLSFEEIKYKTNKTEFSSEKSPNCVSKPKCSCYGIQFGCFENKLF